VRVHLVIEELHRSENDLAQQLLTVSDRHSADHGVHHVARDLATWSQDHVRELARIGRGHGLDLDPGPAGDPGLLARARQEMAYRQGRRSAPALLLLLDLRSIYTDASGVSVDWEVLAQAAQGMKDRELLAVASRCHPQTLRQVRWANSQIKEQAPQIIAS
jgi:2-hydroxychromene-2-carboxylate isomerase